MVICIFNWHGISEEVGEVHVHKMRNKFTNNLKQADSVLNECVVNWLENAINDLSHVTVPLYEYIKYIPFTIALQ